MWEFIIGFLLGVYFWRCWTHPRTRAVQAGLNSGITLPHEEELELHHNIFSSCSQKVRACLGETGLKHRKIHHLLPSSGGWETKMSDYLSNVNPAGTVPVLVHNGHPVYESHEQILYIDRVLMPEGRKLTPADPEKKALVEKYVDLGSMIGSEVMGAADPLAGITKRAGNLLPCMSIPAFCGNCILNFGAWTMLETLSMAPMVKDRKFIMLFFCFKIFGVETFKKLSFLDKILSLTRKGINYHFTTLTADLEASGGPYLCGEQYTLADISMVPIFERMEVARWWTDSVKAEFPRVHQYWAAIQERAGYQASRPDPAKMVELEGVGRQIDQWKREHVWFRDYYEKY